MESIHLREVETIVCLGDLVDYGVEPSYCIERIRGAASICLLGNHDLSAATGALKETFNPEARASTEWTGGQLQEEEKQWLAVLPLTYRLGPFFLVHSAPAEPMEFDYIRTAFDARRQLDKFEGWICFVGHTHLPGAYSSGRSLEPEANRPLQLARGEKWIVNVGSVGQPRDGDPRSCYVVIEPDSGEIQFVRVEYDVASAARKIARVGVALPHATRLLIGR